MKLLICSYCKTTVPEPEAVGFPERGQVRQMHRDCYIKRWNALRRVIEAKSRELRTLMDMGVKESKNGASKALGYSSYRTFMSIKLEDTTTSRIVRKAQELIQTGAEREKMKALHSAAQSFGYRDWHDFCNKTENRI